MLDVILIVVTSIAFFLGSLYYLSLKPKVQEDMSAKAKTQQNKKNEEDKTVNQKTAQNQQKNQKKVTSPTNENKKNTENENATNIKTNKNNNNNNKNKNNNNNNNKNNNNNNNKTSNKKEEKKTEGVKENKPSKDKVPKKEVPKKEEEEESAQSAGKKRRRRKKKGGNKTAETQWENISTADSQYVDADDSEWVSSNPKIANKNALEKEIKTLQEEERKYKNLLKGQTKKLQQYSKQLDQEKHSLADNKEKYRSQISALQSEINELKKKGGLIDNKDLLSKRNYVRSGQAEKVQELNREMAKDAFQEHELNLQLKSLQDKITSLEKDIALINLISKKPESEESEDDIFAEEKNELLHQNIEKEELEKKLQKLKDFKSKDKEKRDYENHLQEEAKVFNELIEQLSSELSKLQAELQEKKGN